MIPARSSILILGFLCVAGLVSRAAQAPLYTDTNQYPPLKLSWSNIGDVRQASGVFPHPLLTQRAVAVSGDGLMITEDAGKSWKKLSAGSAAKLGVVRDIAFHPLQPDTFYAASFTSGVWVTTDNGGTFHQIGTQARGMASDSVVSLLVYPGDPSRHTLLAAHGDAAGGISRSRDEGETWDVVNTDYHFRRLAGGGGNSQQFFMLGSTSKEPDVQNCYSSNAIGEFPIEVIRDAMSTDITRAPIRKPDVMYVSTSDNGISRISEEGGGGVSHDVKHLTAKDTTGWASLAMVWGPNADTVRLLAYDPTKAGLIVSTDDLATTESAGTGLPVSPLVKEGSVVRPNANGTVFYAVVNGALSVGHPPATTPMAEATPPVFQFQGDEEDLFDYIRDQFSQFLRDSEFSRSTGSIAAKAKDLIANAGDLKTPYLRSQLIVTAHVAIQPAPPSSVTIDLSRYGGSPETPMYDDGQHDDGAAGDGTYGLTFAFQPQSRQPAGNETRSTWPGPIALGVTATYPDGRHEGAVAVVGAYRLLKDIDLWNRKQTDISAGTDGTIKARPVLNPPGMHNGFAALRLDADKGSWSVMLGVPHTSQDITSYGAISFWIRAVDGEPPKELNIQLQDGPEFSDPTITPAILVPVNLTKDYQRVVASLDDMLANSAQFQTSRLRKIIISGSSNGPVTFYLDGPRVLASGADVQKPADKAPAK